MNLYFQFDPTLAFFRNGLMKHSTAFAGRPRVETLKVPPEHGRFNVAFSDYR